MYNETKYWVLRNHKLFRSLSQSQLKDLCIYKGYRKAYKNDIIYFTNDDTKRVYILDKGMIKISQTNEEGQEIIREIIHAGDIFGELFPEEHDQQDTEYAQVISKDISICSFKMDDFVKLIESHPDLALSYFKFVGLKLKRLQNKYSNLVFKDTRSRLAAFLTEWAQREGVLDGNTYHINNYLTQEDIGKIVCATRQTVAELLSTFQAEGLIKYNRKTIEISDIKQLK